MKLPTLFGDKTAPQTQPAELPVMKQVQSVKHSKIDWDCILHEWEKSGLTQKQFCKKRKLNLKTFTGQRTRQLKQARNKNNLMPIEINDTCIQEPVKTENFVLQCVTGAQLIIPNDFDKKALRELFIMLGAC